MRSGGPTARGRSAGSFLSLPRSQPRPAAVTLPGDGGGDRLVKLVAQIDQLPQLNLVGIRDALSGGTQHTPQHGQILGCLDTHHDTSASR